MLGSYSPAVYNTEEAGNNPPTDQSAARGSRLGGDRYSFNATVGARDMWETTIYTSILLLAYYYCHHTATILSPY
jgi:hypothetical protein